MLPPHGLQLSRLPELGGDADGFLSRHRVLALIGMSAAPERSAGDARISS
jgi:hypothetical protein